MRRQNGTFSTFPRNFGAHLSQLVSLLPHITYEGQYLSVLFSRQQICTTEGSNTIDSSTEPYSLALCIRLAKNCKTKKE